MATAPPFGLIIPSRPVLVEPQVISQTQYAFSFPAAPRFSHLVAFLLPGSIMPDGTLAGVYIQFPRIAPDFMLLGAIGSEKQSAIFRIKDNSPIRSANEGVMSDVNDDGNGGVGTVTVGISIEPAANISQQLQQVQPTAPTTAGHSAGSAVSTKLLAQRIIKNAFNFLASFAGSAAPGGSEVVPLKSFQDWWTKFERRVENDPGFLERDDS